MKYVLLAALFFSPFAHSEDSPNELQFGPSILGYSRYNGLFYGIETTFARRLTPHWQVLVGASYESSTYAPANVFGIYSGLRYNFGDDFSNAYFAGAGVEWGTRNDFDHDDPRLGWNAYLEVGKRFQLNKAGTWSFIPTVTMNTRGDRTLIRIQPVAFSVSF